MHGLPNLKIRYTEYAVAAHQLNPPVWSQFTKNLDWVAYEVCRTAVSSLLDRYHCFQSKDSTCVCCRTVCTLQMFKSSNLLLISPGILREKYHERIATGYGLDGPGIESRRGRDFPHLSRPALGTHPAFCTMGTGSFPGVKSGGGVTLTPHPLLVPWSWKSRAIPLLPLWAVRPVQSLSVCTSVTFTFTFSFFVMKETVLLQVCLNQNDVTSDIFTTVVLSMSFRRPDLLVSLPRANVPWGCWFSREQPHCE